MSNGLRSQSNKILAGIIVTILCILGLIGVPPAIQVARDQALNRTHQDLAYYWAPVWYQDSYPEMNGEFGLMYDFITNFDYDGDWVGNNNANNIENFALPAYIYYSVVETPTHWFIGYYDYHPLDWNYPPIHWHENDMEGVLLVINKTEGVQWGEFLCMITEAHAQFWQYRDEQQAPSNTVEQWSGVNVLYSEDIDGDVDWTSIDPYPLSTLFTEHEHLKVFVESRGHGVFGEGKDAYTYPLDIARHDENWNGENFHLGMGIIYYPSGVAEEPRQREDNPDIYEAGYALINVEVLWNRRFDIGDECTFSSDEAFNGDDGKPNAANPPWGWDDADDFLWIISTIPMFSAKGEILCHPARLIAIHFDIPGWPDIEDITYTYNPFT
ncbi:MAG: hypothetical protein ACFFD8_04960 [Candidatus Thorarchaeota archaeon]